MQSKNEFDPSKLDRVISKDALTIATRSFPKIVELNLQECQLLSMCPTVKYTRNGVEARLKLSCAVFENPLPSGQNCPCAKCTLLAKILTKKFKGAFTTTFQRSKSSDGALCQPEHEEHESGLFSRREVPFRSFPAGWRAYQRFFQP